jgi:hypothetical protein
MCKFELLFKRVPGAGIEPARPQWSQDFKSCVSTNSTTRANYFPDRQWRMLSERRDSNSRPQPWQGCALPAELLSHMSKNIIASKSDAKVILIIANRQIFLE